LPSAAIASQESRDVASGSTPAGAAWAKRLPLLLAAPKKLKLTTKAPALLSNSLREIVVFFIVVLP
jgi:hypothetical protein